MESIQPPKSRVRPGLPLLERDAASLEQRGELAGELRATVTAYFLDGGHHPAAGVSGVARKNPLQSLGRLGGGRSGQRLAVDVAAVHPE